MPHIIEDWADNVLNVEGKFVRPPCYNPMEFASFEDGWSWIMENIPDTDNAHDDVFVVPKEKETVDA